jgi:hypothetical protein
MCTQLFAQAHQNCKVTPKSFAEMHNCYRPLLVFSPHANDPRLKQQTNWLDQAADDMMDRFVMYAPVILGLTGFTAPLDTPFTLLSAKEMQLMRIRFHIPAGQFTVMLMDEDGSEKLRSTKPVTANRLNTLIDTLPARKREMQRPHAN